MMVKLMVLIGSVMLLITGCDVRNKDKMAQVSAKENQAKNSPAPAPTTVQLIDSVYNFGKVTDGELVEYSYRFKNTGTNPLIVTNATASCGCTVPEKPEQPVLPGEIGYIKIKFNSSNRVGQAHKTVTVTANVQPTFPELLLTGEVVAKAGQ